MRRLTFLIAPLVPAVLGAQMPHCFPARQPDPLPLAMELVDSTALAASLPNSPLGPTTFSLWFGFMGQITHVMALADTLIVRGQAQPDSAAMARARLGTLVAGAAFPQDAGHDFTVRMTVARDASGAMSLAVAPSVGCGPVALPHPSVPNERVRVTSDEIDEYQHATPATISFVVDTTGRALEVLVDRSSGSRLIDDRTVQWITTSRYRPATVDGFPKKMSVRLSVMAPIPASRHGP